MSAKERSQSVNQEGTPFPKCAKAYVRELSKERLMDDAYTFAQPIKKRLISSASLVDRIAPDVSTVVSNASNAPYVTQIISPSESRLLSYSDDGIFRYHDKSTLQVQSSTKWEKGGDCTALVQSQVGYIAAGRRGVIGLWDAKTDAEVASLAGPSKAPYLSLACSGHLVAAGTELKGTDACIDVWDMRKGTKPIVTYIETHSDDVTWLTFHPKVSHVLLSASSDSLAAVSDVRKLDEDDSVLGVINTGASVARLGWGGNSKIRPKMISEDTPGISDIPDLGALWSVSDMQTFGVWEADAWEEVLAPVDIRDAEISDWKTEFIIDATTDTQLTQDRDSVGVLCGNQDGSAALINVSTLPEQPWTMQCRLRGGHSEVIRSVYWDLNNSCVFTGAEDGRICGWQLNGTTQIPEEDTKITTPPAFQERSPRPVKEEKSRPTYKPY